ncbi:MAG: internalin, partial [Segetibacter sp.]|nr:internalin [Segetibacter sp.]
MTFSIGNLTGKKCLLLLCLLFKTFFSLAQLQADFTTDKPGGCSPLTISFTNTSTGTSATTTYKWDLGNGNPSSLKDPGATYREEKTFTITLTATNGAQTSTKTKQITVYKKPVVDFSASKLKGCAPLAVDFTANATAGDGTVSGYFWDFGDGGTQSTTSAQISHNFNFSGKFPVSLTATNSYGCYSTLSKPDLIDVQPGIQVAFTADKTILCKTTDA